MGLFSKPPKPNPKITTQGISVEFNAKSGCWRFTYKGTEFWCWAYALTLPSTSDLDLIVGTVKSLNNEMTSRIEKGLKQWAGENAMVNDGERYSIDLSNSVQGRFVVSWSDGKSWGDLGVDFSVKDGAIIDESWGD